jgi:hypothetical protein
MATCVVVLVAAPASVDEGVVAMVQELGKVH